MSYTCDMRCMSCDMSYTSCDISYISINVNSYECMICTDVYRLVEGLAAEFASK